MLTSEIRKSFGYKIYMSFSLSILIISLIISGGFILYQQRNVKDNLIREGRMLADLLAHHSRTGIFAENRGLLEDSVRGIMNQQNVLAVSIFASEGKPLFHQQKKEYRAIENAVSGSENRVDQYHFIVENDDLISIRKDVFLDRPAAEEALYFEDTRMRDGRDLIGSVEIVLSKEILRQQIKSILLSTLLAIMLSLTANAVVIYFIIGSATGPLTRLTEAVRLFGKGRTVGKVPIESEDEIGRLAMTFNTMSEDLKKREEEKDALEEKLRHAQKMEAVGTLARGIAHDFNNILATISGSVYLLEKKLRDNGTIGGQYTGQIQNSIKKAQELVQGLFTFSRVHKINAAPVDLNMIIRRLTPMLADMAGERIDLRISLSEEALMVIADALQIEQVLMNLCSNARDAMPDGGTLTIETSSVMPFETAEVFARILISDTGTGMDEEIRERIFEPFFTTKDVGKGTGLGLSIVHGIIKQHKGNIELQSKKGEGTAFRILLPLIVKEDGKT